MLMTQSGAFNSPAWFNCIAEGVKREMHLFKFGSGTETETNFSPTSGGTSSILKSFLKIFDKSADPSAPGQAGAMQSAPEQAGSHGSLLSIGKRPTNPSGGGDTRTAGGRLVAERPLLGRGVGAGDDRRAHAGGSGARQERGCEGARLGAEGLGWARTDVRDEDDRLIVREVEAQAATLRRNRALRADGNTLREIAAALEAESHRTKRGGRWHLHTIARALA